MKRICLYAAAVVLFGANLVGAAELTVLSTNDIHGHLDSIEGQGGAATRAGFIKSVKNAEPNVLVLDAGDYAQGTLYYTMVKEDINTKILLMSGYDAIELGNHEFDKGLGHLSKITKNKELNFLCSNISFDNFILSRTIKPYIIKNFDGVRVGIIGIITPKLSSTAKVDTMKVMTSDPVAKLRQMVREIDDQTDVIIVLSHAGLEEDQRIAKSVDGIDVIVGGHSHTMLEEPVVVKKHNGETVLITQNGEFGRTMGKLKLNISGDVIESYEFAQVPMTEAIEPDRAVAAYIEKYSKDIKRTESEVLGSTSVPLDCRLPSLKTSLTNCGALVNAAVKAKYPEADISIFNGAQIRIGKVVPQGKLTKGDVMSMLPFDNNIVLVEMKGKDILSMLETSARKYPEENNGFLQSDGLDYTINTKRPAQMMSEQASSLIMEGKRIENVFVNKEPLNPKKTYVIATTNFLVSKGDRYIQFKDSKIIKNTHDKVITVVEEYIKSQKTVTPTLKNTIEIKEENEP